MTTRKLVIFGLLLFFGCAGRSPQITGAFDETPVPVSETPAGTHRIQAGDKLEITFPFNPDFNATHTVAPDGTVTLKLVGEISAAGLTATQLDSVITREYSRYIIEPQITVRVTDYTNQKIYVGGEVAQPGLVELEGELTLLQALIRAGGLKDSAKKDEIYIYRNGGASGQQALRVDLRSLLDQGPTRHDPVLRPYDVVFVPESGISKAGKFMDKYVTDLLPVSSIAGFAWLLQIAVN